MEKATPATRDMADGLKSILDDVVASVRRAAPGIYDEAVEKAAAAGKPVPGKADFKPFGIAVFMRNGEMFSAGNAEIGRAHV